MSDDKPTPEEMEKAKRLWQQLGFRMDTYNCIVEAFRSHTAEAVKAATEKARRERDDAIREKLELGAKYLEEREARERVEELKSHADALLGQHDALCAQVAQLSDERDDALAEEERLREEKELLKAVVQERAEEGNRTDEIVIENAALRKRVEELEVNIKGWISLHAQELETSGRAVAQARREGAEEMRERAARVNDRSLGEQAAYLARQIRALPIDPPKAPEKCIHGGDLGRYTGCCDFAPVQADPPKAATPLIVPSPIGGMFDLTPEARAILRTVEPMSVDLPKAQSQSSCRGRYVDQPGFVIAPEDEPTRSCINEDWASVASGDEPQAEDALLWDPEPSE